MIERTKKSTRPQMSCFLLKISEEQNRFTRPQMSCFLLRISNQEQKRS